MSGPDLDWVRACLTSLYESKLPVAVQTPNRWDRPTLGEAARILQEDFAALRAENERLRAEVAFHERNQRRLHENEGWLETRITDLRLALLKIAHDDTPSARATAGMALQEDDDAAGDEGGAT